MLGIDHNVEVPYNKCIFVMEDVDAASHVVSRRDGEEGADDPLPASRPSSPLPPLSALSMGKEEDQEEDVEALPSQQHLAMLAAAMAHGRKRKKSGGDRGGMGGMLLGSWGMQDTDELNLAGLLNVLDGVVRVLRV